MQNSPTTKSVLVAFAVIFLAMPGTRAQLVTNWIAYNDHRPGAAIPPHTPVQNNWGTGSIHESLR
ncbi:MAG TPA: hypothetical protein VJS65_08625 [Verrucomicrobiae bacterium]|nr:hypothetical protein [Verrucomicrobiae bacterium]